MRNIGLSPVKTVAKHSKNIIQFTRGNRVDSLSFIYSEGEFCYQNRRAVLCYFINSKNNGLCYSFNKFSL